MRRPVWATAWTDRDICSIDADVLLDRARQALGHRADFLDRRRHLVDRRRGLLGGGGEIVGVARDALDRLRHLLDRRRRLRHGAASDSVSRLTRLDRRRHLGDRGGHLLRRRRHLLRRRGDGLDRGGASPRSPPTSPSPTRPGCVVLAVTCSIDAASSLIDDTSCSVDAAMRLGLRRGLLERGRHLVQPAERLVERADLDVGAVRRPRRRCGRCRRRRR